MFKKLFKHEFKNTSKLGFPLLLGVLLAGVLAILSILLLTSAPLVGDGTIPDVGDTDIIEISANAASFFGGLLLMIVVLALSFASVGMFVILVIRFYQSTLSDEGYLTFTLPVTASQIFGVKLLNALLWMLMTGVALAIAIAVAFLTLGLRLHAIMGVEFAEMLAYFFEEVLPAIFEELQGVLPGEINLYVVMLALRNLIAPVVTIIEIFTVILFVGMKTKKNRVLMIVLLYFGVQFVINSIGGTLNSILTTFPAMQGDVVDLVLMMGISQLLCFFIDVAVAVGGFFLSRSLMTRKLNLD